MRALLTMVAGFMLAAPTLAAGETLSATFTTPDGGITANSYSGIVKVHVEGNGESEGSAINDAFYLVGPPQIHDSSYYQSHSVRRRSFLSMRLRMP